MVTVKLDSPELAFLTRRIDEYIQVVEFMARKNPALEPEELVLARKLVAKLNSLRGAKRRPNKLAQRTD